MPLKKVDNRIRTLVENGVSLGHRSLFVVVGDHGRDQVRTVCTPIAEIPLKPVYWAVVVLSPSLDAKHGLMTG